MKVKTDLQIMELPFSKFMEKALRDEETYELYLQEIESMDVSEEHRNYLRNEAKQIRDKRNIK